MKSTEVDWGEIVETGEHVSITGQKSARLKLYPVETVVVALYGQGKARGKCAILGIPATMNQACAGISPSPTLTSTYIFHLLKQSYLRLRGKSRGGNQENLNLGIVKSFEVPVPSLNAQKAFAEIAHRVDLQRQTFVTSADKADKFFVSCQQRAFEGNL